MRTLRRHWLQLLLSTLVLGCFLAYAAHLWRPRALEQIDHWLYDARLVATMPGGIDPRVVVVDLDERSLAELGRWPWPRKLVAEMVDKLVRDYQAAVVGFDIVFAERDDSSGLPVLQQLAQTTLRDEPAFQQQFLTLRTQLDYDAQLAASLRERPVVLGYYFSFRDAAPRSGVLPKPALPAGIFTGRSVQAIVAPGYGANLPVLMAQAGAAGHFNPLTDSDGVTRRVAMLVEHEGRYYESLSLAMVRSYLNYPALQPVYGASPLKSYQPLEWLRLGPLAVPVDEHIRALVPYRGEQRSFAYLSAVDVLKGRVSKDMLAGRMVLIGTTAPGLLDLRVTPVAAAYPGVEVHANLIASMLDGSLPAQPDYLRAAELLMLLLSSGLALLVLLKLNPLPATVSTALLVVAVILLNFALWHYARLALPLAASLLSILLLYAISMAYGYFFEARNKKQMASLFGQYVPPELVARMSEEPGKYSMDGQSRELTVLFSDVRGFTTISESMEPKELTRFMNEFLTTLSEVIRNRYLGTIDKYMGDCVMAFWGAPIHDPDHARSAVLAALAMQEAMKQLGPSLEACGWPRIQIGIGINTGRMTVGDMGSQIRKAYTVMGDAVNLASRLEGLTKHYGVGILVGEQTRAAAGPDLVFKELDRVRVKGKDAPVTLYQPLGLADQLSDSARAELALFQQALKLYRAQNWDLAELQLLNLQQRAPQCVLCALYLRRIQYFRHSAPPTDWDGVYDFDSK